MFHPHCCGYNLLLPLIRHTTLIGLEPGVFGGLLIGDNPITKIKIITITKQNHRSETTGIKLKRHLNGRETFPSKPSRES